MLECSGTFWNNLETVEAVLTPPVTGKILEILQDEHETMAFVVVDIFQVSALRHEYFGMPILSRRLDETTVLIIPAKVCQFSLNFQLKSCPWLIIY